MVFVWEQPLAFCWTRNQAPRPVQAPYGLIHREHGCSSLIPEGHIWHSMMSEASLLETRRNTYWKESATFFPHFWLGCRQCPVVVVSTEIEHRQTSSNSLRASPNVMCQVHSAHLWFYDIGWGVFPSIHLPQHARTKITIFQEVSRSSSTCFLSAPVQVNHLSGQTLVWFLFLKLNYANSSESQLSVFWGFRTSRSSF